MVSLTQTSVAVAASAVAVAASRYRLPSTLLGRRVPTFLRINSRFLGTDATAKKIPIPKTSGKVKIALIQLSVGADKTANIERASKAVAKAAARGAEVVVLPEIWNSPYSNASFPVAAEDVEGGASKSADALRSWAIEHGVVLVGGSIPERGEGGAIFNTSLTFGPDGSLLGKHRKLHLFDIDIPGGIRFVESETLTAGDTPTVVDTPGGFRFGVGICYDLRFPELAAIYASRGVHAILYPGAFNTVTGPLHWELLQRARAVDNALWVATASPARDDAEGSYHAWGHSSLVDPSGHVVATTEHDEDIVFGEIDLAAVDARRSSIPVLDQKRDDLYALLDKTRLA